MIEMMRTPVVNLYAEDVTPDYTHSIAHVQNVLDELKERKQRSDELCDVRRIKLQQLLQLRTCERDAEQVGYFSLYFACSFLYVNLISGGTFLLWLLCQQPSLISPRDVRTGDPSSSFFCVAREEIIDSVCFVSILLPSQNFLYPNCVYLFIWLHHVPPNPPPQKKTTTKNKTK